MNQPAKTRSAVTFVRKGLGLKGSTEHNGRGVYECSVRDETVTWDKLKELVLKKVEDWKAKGLVVEVKQNHREVRGANYEVIQVVLDPKVFGEYYRTAYFDQYNYGSAICGRMYAVLC